LERLSFSKQYLVISTMSPECHQIANTKKNLSFAVFFALVLIGA